MFTYVVVGRSVDVERVFVEPALAVVARSRLRLVVKVRRLLVVVVDVRPRHPFLDVAVFLQTSTTLAVRRHLRPRQRHGGSNVACTEENMDV